jgi:hypothetical protein
VQRAVHVQPLHRGPALRRDGLGGREVLAAGVVEQRVDAAVALEGNVDDPLAVRALANVAGDPRAARPDLVRSGLQDRR